MTEEKLKKVFSNEKFVKKLLEQKSPQKVQELLEENDIELSLVEIEKVTKLIQRKLANIDEELSDDDLGTVAGGCNAVSSIVLPVLLAVTALGGTAILESNDSSWFANRT